MLEELKLKDEYVVTIKNQDHFGNGVVRVKEMTVFVKNALPNEKCKIQITKISKTFAEAKVIEYISLSEDRCEVVCPYYNKCGGCSIMHQSKEGQLQYKENKIREIFNKFADMRKIPLNKIVSGDNFNYRNKAKLHAENNKFGFYKEKTNDIVPIESCAIVDPMINTIIEKIKEYCEENKKEKVENLMIRITNTNEIMVVVEGKLKKDFTNMLEELGVTTIFVNNKITLGKGYITEKIFEMNFQLSPRSFFQVNYEMMLMLYKIILNFYKEKKYSKVLDLYCGTGTIGMLLTPYIEQVVGIEVETVAVENANNNKEINNVKNIEFIRGRVEDEIDTFSDIDSIIVDPPRMGLDNKTIKAILDIEPKSIVYVSCDPVTLARDIKILDKKYELVEITPIDMFPNTYHVETVSILNKRKK